MNPIIGHLFKVIEKAAKLDIYRGGWGLFWTFIFSPCLSQWAKVSSAAGVMRNKSCCGPVWGIQTVYISLRTESSPKLRLVLAQNQKNNNVLWESRKACVLN